MPVRISKNITFFKQAYYIPFLIVSGGGNPDIQSSVTSKLRFQGG